MAAICVIMLLAIWKDFKWEYLYLKSEERIEKIASYSDADGLCVLDVGWKISGNFSEIIHLKTMTFFQDDIGTLNDMEELKSKDEYVLYALENDPEEIIEQIFEICPQIDQYEYIGSSDYAEIYYLYSSNE